MTAPARLVVSGTIALFALSCSRVDSNSSRQVAAPWVATSQPGVVWRWHQPGTELYDAQFSPDGTDIALVRKRHMPDGHEAESISIRSAVR
jgi:hypothetical protein